MPYTVILPTYQVETRGGNNVYHDLETAKKEYERKCERNIPTELYKDGILIKEYKPIF